MKAAVGPSEEVTFTWGVHLCTYREHVSFAVQLFQSSLSLVMELSWIHGFIEKSEDLGMQELLHDSVPLTSIV